MRLYLEIARRGFRRYATYRAATLAGLFTNTMFGFLRGYVLLAIFRFRDVAGGFDATDTITYAWATQGLIMMVWVWGWEEVAERVREGHIATDLLRPVDLQAYWLAHDIGRASFHLLFRGLPPFIVGSFFFDLRLPEHTVTVLLLVVSTYLAVALSFAYKFILNLTAFWLLDIRGVSTWGGLVMNLMSGFIVPIVFFPGWAEGLARALPWAGMVQTPIEVFLEKPGALTGIALQAAWTVALLAVGRLMMAAGTRKLVIQGG